MSLLRVVSALLLLLAGMTAAQARVGEARSPKLVAHPDRLELRGAEQKLVFQRGPDGRFRMTSFVRKGVDWEALFDGELPLVQGKDFDLLPTAYRVLENSVERAAVELSGTHAPAGYPWKLLVEARSSSPFIHLRLTCDLDRPLTLSGLEPQFALWMKQPEVALRIDQGPGGIYQGTAEREWGNSFPAAYLWDAGREAAIFFDMGAMTWLSHRNLFRFRDLRVQAFPEAGRTGFGLRVVKRNFHELTSGDVVFDAYLFSGARPSRPSRLDALDRVVRLCAPLHPKRAPLPRNRKPPYRTSWEVFADGVSRNLMLPDQVWADVELPADAPWRDGPLFPEDTVSRLRVSGDYAVDSACEPRFNRKSVLQGWDFSTTNNYLAGWIGYDRLKPDPSRRRFLEVKETGLPLFYDPQARLIRHSTRYPPRVGEKEMSWQNLMFALEMVKVYRMLPAERFRPAIPGKFLLGTEGLIALARGNDYRLPQWFDPYRKTPLVQGDEPELGVIYEPWQIGTYAYLMGEAYTITGDREYLREARAGLDRLFGGMQFTVENRRYRAVYADPTEFPITEIFGNAWGVAAATRVYRWTGDPRYRRYSDHFLNSLLRMTYWYESALRDDPKDLSLQNAGLFRNQAGAYTGSPWETSEAYLALTVRLKHDPEVREPLPRLFNLQRVNSFHFFPPVFTDAAIPCRKLYDHVADYLPIEDSYTHEHGGANGGMGRCIYMSGIAFWNYLMYEALATADDPEVMALNLDVVDGFDAAVASLRRHFLLYNGSETRKQARVSMRALADGTYRMSLRRRSGRKEERVLPAASLRDGVAVSLEPDGPVRLELVRLNAERERRRWERARASRDRMAHAYQRLQQAAARTDERTPLNGPKVRFREAEAAYRRNDFARAGDLATGILREVRGNGATAGAPRRR